jgi:uncharacterized membrane protein YhaH (DUF805 family)
MHALDVLFSFHGRISRAIFWTYLPIATLVLFSGLMLAWSVFMGDRLLGLAIAVFTGVLFLLCIAGLCVKRLHDRDRSGLWTLIVLLPLPLFALEHADVGGPLMGLAAIVLSAVVFSLVIVELGLLTGTAGANRYGEQIVLNRRAAARAAASAAANTTLPVQVNAPRRVR